MKFVSRVEEKFKSKIIFLLSERHLQDIKQNRDATILFPLSDEKNFWKIDEQGNLIFMDDLLKSAFYLLSGYQEYKVSGKDRFGRYPHTESVQYQFNFTNIPLVNIYFRIIAEGIRAFCDMHNIAFKNRRIWQNGDFGFIVTHDVDRVDKWTWHETKYKLKQVLGMSSTPYSKSMTCYLLFQSIVNLFTKVNPYWNFEWLKKTEKKHDIHSVWYFLPKGDKYIDALYSFKEKRIIDLVRYLEQSGDEICLHGVFKSKVDLDIMQNNRAEIQSLSQKPVVGIRQHWLSFEYPATLQNQERLGFQHDSSWYFAEHVGWRNSYCFPFHPYDFQQKEMMKIWEIPLCMMDASLFDYQEFSLFEAANVFENLLEQVRSVHGLFVLLWHNSYFDEVRFPGITDFYKGMLRKIMELRADCVLPQELISRFEEISASTE
ncbi:polysaccharide deacetylase family protein [bacterium]|nr:polysaccharide deacetylase family protein [bacterium]